MVAYDETSCWGVAALFRLTDARRTSGKRRESATAASASNAPATVNCMLDWPEHSHTSPKATLRAVRDAAGVCARSSRPEAAGWGGNETSQDPSAAARALAEVRTDPSGRATSTVTSRPGVAQPHTCALAGARWSTMLEPMNVGRRSDPSPTPPRDETGREAASGAAPETSASAARMTRTVVTTPTDEDRPRQGPEEGREETRGDVASSTRVEDAGATPRAVMRRDARAGALDECRDGVRQSSCFTGAWRAS